MIPKLSSSKIRKRCFFNEETGTIQKIWRNLQAWIMRKNASAVLSISHQKNKTKKFVKMEVANTFYATKKIKCSYNICEDKRISAISTLDIVINSDNNHHLHTHTHTPTLHLLWSYLHTQTSVICDSVTWSSTCAISQSAARKKPIVYLLLLPTDSSFYILHYQ